MIKKTLSWGQEESFKIYAGETVVFTSPVFESVAERVMEACFATSTNHVYRIEMKDSAGDSWSDGAWIEIKDINDAVVFKAVMIGGQVENSNFGLCSPILKSGVWKSSNAFSNDWNQYSFSDAAWTEVTLGTDTQEATSTIYFRKTFAGVTGMAAILTQFKYSEGVVAYINGAEIFRDNMPEGEIAHSTPASGSYTTADFHGVIRPSYVAEAGQSVLAVELHFTDATARTIGFDAYLSYAAGVNATNNCYASYVPVTATGVGVDDPDRAFDYEMSMAASAERENFPAKMTMSFTGNMIPMANGFRIWPYGLEYNPPSAFSLKAANAPTATTWTPLLNVMEQTYTALQWKYYVMFSEPGYYKAYQMEMTASADDLAYIYELQFLVCNMGSQTIQYDQPSYSYYARFSAVNLQPTLFGITSCQSSPELPTGLTLSSGCVIMGSAAGPSAMTTYTITATSGSRTASGTVGLAFTDCQGTMLRIVRMNQADCTNEAYRIRNTANDEMLLNVEFGHPCTSGEESVDFLCVTAERYDVTVDGNQYWDLDSYLYLYAMLGDENDELIMKIRYDALNGNEHTQYLRRHTINIGEQWYYKMEELPANWFDDNTSGWSQSAKGSFPPSTNTIQLYKKTFTVSDVSLVSGYILNIRYKYGCIVYLNGHEAFRNHLAEGAITTSSTATGSYSALRYRTITLPGRFVNADGSDPTVLLKQGSNTIAIGLIATAGQTTADFDATVRLMTNVPESHIWEFSGSDNGVYGTYRDPFSGYYNDVIYNSNCGSNYIEIVLANDRREWINMIQVQSAYDNNLPGAKQFGVFVRNSNDEYWTQISQAMGVSYSIPGQKRNLYFINHTPYNQYRFADFGSGSFTDCAWEVQSLGLFATNVMSDPAPLSYPAQTTIFKDIEMSELIPEGDGYYNYSIYPQLPEGLTLDMGSGWISGTSVAFFPATTFTVTANKVTGGTATAEFSLACEACTGGKSLMTVRIYADNYPNENSWKLYEGRGTSGTVLKSMAMFPVRNSYYYLDFCMNDGFYTFEGRDSFGDGWGFNTGYTLTVDMGAMELDIEELWGQGNGTPRTVSTTFSTYFPFQIDFTEWRVYQDGEAPAGWNTPAFDDSTWMLRKAEGIPNPTSVTTYIRKAFELSGIDDYQVLNVRVKYAGGVVVYFNGNKVARFNIIKNFDANTESIEVHDATSFSRFHIILATSGVQEGTNVVAFEIHRPVGTSSSEAFVFDATGVFGVETCSTVVDSLSFLNSTSVFTGTVQGMMDLDPSTSGTLPMQVGSFVEWVVENLEGSKWNSFNVVGGSDVNAFGFEVYGYMDPVSDYSITLLHSNDPLRSRTKQQMPTPVALAGFRKFRYEVLQSIASNTIGAMFGAYGKASGAVCPGIGQYPAVAEGQISPAPCEEGFLGYAYRNCTNGELGEVQTDKCIYKAPEDLHYKSARFTFVKGTASTTDVPTYRNIVTVWHLEEGVSLPAGLSLNEKTGEISGVPTEVIDVTSFQVYGENPNSVASVVIVISIRNGRCNAEGVFPVTEVDEVAEYHCSDQGSYIGTQRRACTLGEKDGEWQKASGFCMSVAVIVIVVVVVIIVIVVIVLILIRAGKKSKSVGGVKGKKTTKTVVTKAPKLKNVKV